MSQLAKMYVMYWSLKNFFMLLMSDI